MTETRREWRDPLGGTPPGGMRDVQNLGIELDAVLRRHGIAEGLAALDLSGGDRIAGLAVDNMVRAEDHQRLNAATRRAMRHGAVEAWSRSQVSEQMRSNFLAFIMKATVPAVGNGWVIPYSSWAEATEAFTTLYTDAAKWDEWVRDVA